MRLARTTEWIRARTVMENGVWASSNRQGFAGWREGELLVVFVATAGVLLARVSGRPFRSDLVLWNGELFEHRIPVHELKLVDGARGEELNARIRGALAKTCRSYGWVIVTQAELPKEAEREVVLALSDFLQ